MRISVSVLSGLILFITLFFASCSGKTKNASKESIQELALKRGEIISCGPTDKQFGSVGFATSCSQEFKKDFDLGIALLHSFEYDEAEKAFAKVIDQEPGCAMAYWGVAMSNFHTLWAPPTPEELKKGEKAVAIARSISNKSERESDYVEAIAVFFENHSKKKHAARCNDLLNAMEQLYKKYPEDKEATIFYALTLTGTADPSDKTYAKQKKAGEILNTLVADDPEHPGIIHYIIHSYDYPELAEMALPAARKYASIAPSSAHAQHMPSHIFTRLGLWDEGIQSNMQAWNSAKCYGENTGIKGHWDEELHALDYLVYSYLQKADNDKARSQLEYLHTITEVFPVNFKVAYAFAAIPARYHLENKMWKEAASLQLHPANFEWNKYPWQKGIHHFARLLGNVHTGQLDSARMEMNKLTVIRDTLLKQQDVYKTNQVNIQLKAGLAWILFKEGKTAEALFAMNEAADMEDKTQKHSVTPGEVIPARELLADMLLQLNQPDKALVAYEADLKSHMNRFNGLFGAAMAAERSGNPVKAAFYYQELVKVASASSARQEVEVAKKYLAGNKSLAKSK